jgi:hypothetical protein
VEVLLRCLRIRTHGRKPPSSAARRVLRVFNGLGRDLPSFPVQSILFIKHFRRQSFVRKGVLDGHRIDVEECKGSTGVTTVILVFWLSRFARTSHVALFLRKPHGRDAHAPFTPLLVERAYEIICNAATAGVKNQRGWKPPLRYRSVPFRFRLRLDGIRCRTKSTETDPFKIHPSNFYPSATPRPIRVRRTPHMRITRISNQPPDPRPQSPIAPLVSSKNNCTPLGPPRTSVARVRRDACRWGSAVVDRKAGGELPRFTPTRNRHLPLTQPKGLSHRALTR